MEYLSTRGAGPVDLEEALLRGLAPDGGLFVPVTLPHFSAEAFAGRENIVDIAVTFLSPFVAGTRLEAALDEICSDAFSFPIPLRALPPAEARLSVLELFHGPTAAFKDVGARFLAACMARLDAGQTDTRPLTILVATSGDTGGAVAAAFHGRPGFRVVVLYPEGQVSPRQAHQLACWGGNVLTLAVDGPFDACQRLVKQAFSHAEIARDHRLCSANSINIGRLLPQAVYYAAASLWHQRQHGTTASFIIPTGNLGNAQACVMARECGLPIEHVVLATNANRTIVDYLASGDYAARPSVQTLASAMDVGDPSNMERLRHLFPVFERLRGKVTAVSVSDEEIREQIRLDATRRGELWCPHTATAARVHDQLGARLGEGPWTLVATAHPAKFHEIVEPLVGQPVPVPPALAELLGRPTHEHRMAADLDALARQLATG
ncbi:MAG: threonine synthase [Gammaproteobacteria bacterium]|nr:threonine synthase [Gammaproteobacteria bacterium]